MTPEFYARPFAHRGLHGPGAAENSLAAMIAAVEAGYGIELDLQLSKDGQAMVFHDYSLDRLTDETGPTRQRTADKLGQIALSGGGGTIPTLNTVLEAVAGRVPLLIEIKDQDGVLGPNVGALEEATAAALKGYDGPVALMSFNPYAVAAMAKLCPDLPRGLTTCNYEAEHWPMIPAATRERLAGIPDFDAVGARFISHDRRSLTAGPVAALKAKGVPIFCWTVRSPQEEAAAREIADQITFEGYPAP